VNLKISRFGQALPFLLDGVPGEFFSSDAETSRYGEGHGNNSPEPNKSLGAFACREDNRLRVNHINPISRTEKAMITKQTKNGLPRFRDALTCLMLLLILRAVCPAQKAGRFRLSPPSLQPGPLIAVEPQSGPRPPCGRDPIPPYPDLNHLAVVKSWSKSDLGPDWKPPACTGWNGVGYTTLVTISARFPYAAGAGGLLGHIGAISDRAGLQYWSTTHKQWQTLVLDAHALTNSQPGQRRGDFTSDDMKEGKVLYFEQIDNLSGKALYRMHIIEASASRIVFDLENVSTMRYWYIPIFRPGDLQSMYFLDRESESVWRYYSIARIGVNAGGVIAGNEASSVNRAVAIYRYLVGIPSTREPPGAR
jgi:hypothetical protein